MKHLPPSLVPFLLLAVACSDDPRDPPSPQDDVFQTNEDMPLVLQASDLLQNDGGFSLAVADVGSADFGEVSLADGQITYVPPADASGTATFRYVVSNPDGMAEATVTVEILPVDDPPVTQNDRIQGTEDEVVLLPAADLLANDRDVEGRALSVVSVIGMDGAQVSLVDDTITYVPPSDTFGLVRFTYVVSDGTTIAEGIAEIDLAPIDDPPRPSPDALFGVEDTPVALDDAALLANDVEVDGEALRIVEVIASTGTIEDRDGIRTFVPPENASGVFQATYRVSDDRTVVDETVTITLEAVNDPPVAVDDRVETGEDQQLTLRPEVLTANDFDVDSPAITLRAVDGAQGGTVQLRPEGVVFTPTPDFFGTARFEYELTDGVESSRATVIVSVTAVNDPPRPVDDVATTDEDVPLTVAAAILLGNDVDVEGDALSLTAVSATDGTAVVTGGQVVFTPAANFNGITRLSYVVSDGDAEALGVVQVTVNPVNDPPVTAPDTATTDEDVATALSAAFLLSNDTDVDGDPLTLVSVTSGVGGTVARVGGAARFTPAENFNGEARFTYVVTDGTATASGQVTVTVRSVNDAPVAVDDTSTTNEDVDLTITQTQLTANDTDVDQDPLQLTSVQNPTGGTVEIIGANVRFSPTPDFNGPASFEYTISDGALEDTGQVTVTVTAVNDPPTAADDAVTTAEDTPAAIAAATLLANDTDVDNDPLTVIGASNASPGTVNLAGTTITFTPPADFNGDASFEYTIRDGTETSVAEVTVTVTPVNDAPVAVDDAVEATANSTATFTLETFTANDTDVDGDVLTVAAVSRVSGGTPSLNSGIVRFAPTAGFVGTASFDYVVSDGALSDTGRVTVTVRSCNPQIDTDNDRLNDCIESGSLVFIDAQSPGTRPDDPDTDGDGILDGDEVLGTTGNLDLPALGAHPLRKDIFIEYDWFDDSLECGAHSHRPTSAMVRRVTTSFANAPGAKSGRHDRRSRASRLRTRRPVHRRQPDQRSERRDRRRAEHRVLQPQARQLRGQPGRLLSLRDPPAPLQYELGQLGRCRILRRRLHRQPQLRPFDPQRVSDDRPRTGPQSRSSTRRQRELQPQTQLQLGHELSLPIRGHRHRLRRRRRRCARLLARSQHRAGRASLGRARRRLRHAIDRLERQRHHRGKRRRRHQPVRQRKLRRQHAVRPQRS